MKSWLWVLLGTLSTAFLAESAAAERGTEFPLPAAALPAIDLAATDDALFVASRTTITKITAHEIRSTAAPGRIIAIAPRADRVVVLFAHGAESTDGERWEKLGAPIDERLFEALDVSFSDKLIVLARRKRDGVMMFRVGDIFLGPLGIDHPIPGATNSVSFRGGVWDLDAAGRLHRRPKPAFETISVNKTNRVHAIARAASGELWCATQEGIARLDTKGRVQTIDTVLGRTLGIVTAIAVDREGAVWIGSGSSFTGVYRKGPDGWTHIGASTGFVDAYVHGITADRATGAVWFSVLNAPGASMDAGLGAWLFSGGRFQRFPPERVHGQLPSNRVYDVVRDPSGVVWFGTLKGLAALEGDRLVPYTRAEGLREDKAWALAAARDGSLWLAYQTGHGVTRIARGEVRHFDKSTGLSHNDVWALAEGRPGVMWFATPAGLDRYDGRRWSHFSTADGLPVDRLWPLLADSDGSLWIGTIGGGLVRMRTSDREAPRTTIELNGSEITWSAKDAWHETAPATIRYRYRWDEGAWSAATTVTRIAIPAAGHRRLQVQAIDRFGNMERPPSRLLLAVPAAHHLLLPWMITFSTTFLCVVLVLVARKRR